MENWHIIGPVSNYSTGNKWIVEVNKKPIALFKYENSYYALKNGCMHQGFPLVDGNLNKYMVECPLHGWVYDIRDGKCLSLGDRYTVTYKLRINNDNIEINLK
tara:strand:+ start:271 stop:579 length:309 start_codon:yes stop_codon:yes gene_type:complete